MIQQALIGVIFLTAGVYLVRLAYQSFRGSSSCTTGCGKCSAIDFQKLEQEVLTRTTHRR